MFSCFSALRWCRGPGAVNKPILLCCLKLWNMMGLSVTTQQVFHGQTLNFAKNTSTKICIFLEREKCMTIFCIMWNYIHIGMYLILKSFMSLNIFHKNVLECQRGQSWYSSEMRLLEQKQLKKTWCKNNQHLIETIWLSVEWPMNI